MEEKERERTEPDSRDSLTLFADKIANSLLKETIAETNSVKIWSIPCSADCHNRNTGSQGSVSVGSLCWTPETCSNQNPTEPSGAETCSHSSPLTCCQRSEESAPSKLNQQSADENDVDSEVAKPSSSRLLESPSRQPDGSNLPSPRDGTDLVHPRLSGRPRDLHTDRDPVAGTSANLGEERLEFRNMSAENLSTQEIHHNGIKKGLRKGLSVNDITECSPHPSSTGCCNKNSPDCCDKNSGCCNKNSSRRNFLKSFGLKKNRDEVTQKLSDGEEYRVDRGGRNKIKNFRKTLTNMFHFKTRDHELGDRKSSIFKLPSKRNKSLPPGKRALPPVPSVRVESRTPSPQSDLPMELEGEWSGPPTEPRPPLSTSLDDESQMDFAASIEKVKDRGWYWGPLSGEAAERILSGEPDGSFVVRDSSDHHYIFSLTFKLNGFVRHVRIEHDQGNFSFGSFTKFKSTTIVDFIENAVEHSRSGRYLFFLHRRPVLGPMRVQLLHPVSRFKRVQSLQHLCRYVIVKHVRKDHLEDLPVPNRIKLYLNTPFYYSEQVEEEAEESNQQGLDTSGDSDLSQSLQDQDPIMQERLMSHPTDDATLHNSETLSSITHTTRSERGSLTPIFAASPNLPPSRTFATSPSDATSVPEHLTSNPESSPNLSNPSNLAFSGDQ